MPNHTPQRDNPQRRRVQHSWIFYYNSNRIQASTEVCIYWRKRRVENRYRLKYCIHWLHDKWIFSLSFHLSHSFHTHDTKVSLESCAFAFDEKLSSSQPKRSPSECTTMTTSTPTSTAICDKGLLDSREGKVICKLEVLSFYVNLQSL